MANEHPFQHLFETLGRVPVFHAETVNRQAYTILSDILTVPVEKSGRCILLRAPRAGHGKTHLLSRIQHQLGASHEFIPLHAAFGCRIDAASVIDDTLRRLVRQLPASGGLCVLDLVTRRLFASALQPLVSSGEVPCQDREGALSALRMRPIETFDFHHPNAVTAHWARENFEVLGQRLSLELANRSGLPVREIAFWVDVLFRFAAAPLENSNRVRLLADAVHASVGGEMERLEALLGLVSLLMRVVLVADDLEGFSTDEAAALRVAAFLGSLRQSVDRLDVILSLNQDIWQSAFVPRLSGGLADRLSEVVVELEPLKESEMAALLDSRVPGLGNTVLEHIDTGTAGTHARGLIRAAGMAWLKATATDTAPPVTVSPVSVPPPIKVPLPEPPPLISEIISPAPPVEAPAPAFKVILPEPEPEPEPVVRLEVEPPAPASFIPEPAPVFEAAVPLVEEFNPVTSSPFIAPPQELESAWPAPEFTPAPPVEMAPEPAIYQAPLDSPFQVDPQPWTPPPPVANFVPEEYQAPVTPQFTPPAPPENTWNPPSPVAQFTPEPVSYVAEVESPFQIAPQDPVDSFTPPAWQEPPPYTPEISPPSMSLPVQEPEPTAYFQTPPEPPFQAPPQEFTPAPQNFEPTPESVPQPTEPPEATAADTDRVDDLLRQFRERYGRGSL